MSFTTTANRVSEIGNGAKVAFTFSFKAFQAADLKVYKVDASNIATLQTITTDYTVSLNTTVEGGVVTYVVAPTAVQSSLIIREVSLSQTTAIPRESNFPEQSMENALDKAIMATQQLQEQIDRSIVAAVGTTSTGITLPAPTANKGVAWNSAGTNLENTTQDLNNVASAASTSAAAALVSQTAAAASATATLGFQNLGTWSSVTTYGVANIVTYTQASSVLGTFQSLQASNLNQNPETATTFWEKLAEGGAGTPILMTNIVQTTGEATLLDAQENFLDGCFLTKNSDTVLQVGPGSAMINGKLRRNTVATTNTPTLTASKWNDVFLVADAAASTFTIEVITNLATPGAGTATGTNTRRIGSIFSDSLNDLSYYINNRDGFVEGWQVFGGNGTNGVNTLVTHGVTFTEDLPIPFLSMLGRKSNPAINELAEIVIETGSLASTANFHSMTPTLFNMTIRSEVGTIWDGSTSYGFTWRLSGRFTL